MDQRKIIGVSAAIIIFVFWLVVDALLFPYLLTTMNYSLYELIVYGSWFVLILLIVGIISWSGAIPNPYSGSKSTE